MSLLELHRAAGESKERHGYAADHAMRDSQARRDRTDFLIRSLNL